jgi:hypothetical protein
MTAQHDQVDGIRVHCGKDGAGGLVEDNLPISFLRQERNQNTSATSRRKIPQPTMASKDK